MWEKNAESPISSLLIIDPLNDLRVYAPNKITKLQ